MAKKRKKKRNWLKTLLFFIFTPFIIWFLAFVIWFYWNDITDRFNRHEKIPSTKANKPIDGSTKPADQTSQERIREEDRRKLDEILKNKK